MADIKPLRDKLGILIKVKKSLPSEYYQALIDTLAELEDNECHKKHKFPHTELHPVLGIKDKIYNCYIHKLSGWRFQVQYSEGFIELLNLTTPEEHDRVGKIIKTKRNKF